MIRAVLHRVYLWGYTDQSAPRWARRLFARSDIHRAWLLGFHGVFEEAGQSYGPTNPYEETHDHTL